MLRACGHLPSALRVRCIRAPVASHKCCYVPGTLQLNAQLIAALLAWREEEEGQQHNGSATKCELDLNRVCVVFRGYGCGSDVSGREAQARAEHHQSLCLGELGLPAAATATVAAGCGQH